ncbi:MAG: L,D-transpeptidase [Liquorilactobacillus ghanensis]|uniref:L,D-transpeptidase n=1 Tax=Liquorilactobacillus ghanensis TaxID=399370 RepID=UPI0039EC554E
MRFKNIIKNNLKSKMHRYREYLFHSTPTASQGDFIQSDANDLGKKPSSHGCVHLSISDSKWIYENIKYGTKVWS